MAFAGVEAGAFPLPVAAARYATVSIGSGRRRVSHAA